MVAGVDDGIYNTICVRIHYTQPPDTGGVEEHLVQVEATLPTGMPPSCVCATNYSQRDPNSCK